MNAPDLNKIREQAEKINEYLIQNDTELDYDLILNEYGIDIKQLEQDMINNVTQLDLGYFKINGDVVSPKYNYESDSGFDLYSTEEITIDGLGRALVPTGLSFDIKDGYEIQVRSKSGLAINQGLMCLNSPGTVDNGYTGEVQVIIFNANNSPFTIEKGMKVAQGVFSYVVNGTSVEFTEVDSINEKDRNANGFGSTGI
jgi:dUTP pyrophosphatase